MIILTGFQAPGTRCATLASSARAVRIHGREVEVNAEVVQLESTSAHADANQILAWLRTMPKAPDQVYVVHGEPGLADELANASTMSSGAGHGAGTRLHLAMLTSH